MSLLDWVTVGVFFALVAAYGWAKSARLASMKDYAVASARVGTLGAFASLTSTYIGPGFTLGLAEKGFEHGLVFLIVFLGFSIQTFIVGIFLAPRLHGYTSALSVGDVIGQHYGRTSQVLTGILSMLYCAGIVGVVAKAGGSIFSAMTGAQSWIGTLLITGVVLVYTVRGGIKAVISTDHLQFLILLIGVPIVLFGAWSMLSTSTELAPLPDAHLSPLGTFSPLAVCGLFLGFLFGETLVPPYSARCLITKKSNQARSAFAFSALFSVAWFATIVGIGIIGRKVMPDVNGADIFIEVAFESLGTGLLGLVVAAVIAIIMSTQDSFLNSASVSFTRDLWMQFQAGGSMDDRKQVRVTMIVAFLVASLGALFALLIPGLIEGILAVYTLWAPTVIIPLVAALLTRVKHPFAGTVAILAGGGVAAIWHWALEEPLGIPALAPGIIANVLAFVITLLISRSRIRTISTNEVV